MTWSFIAYTSNVVKMITPEQLAKSGSESGHQKALFCHFALKENQQRYPDAKWMFAIPNGKLRNIIDAANLKAEGVKAGVPDIVLPVRRNWYCGMFMELKRQPKTIINERFGTVKTAKAGKTSTEQNEWLFHLSQQGYYACIAYGWEQAVQEVIQYLDRR
jgi:hypothetical protein